MKQALRLRNCFSQQQRLDNLVSFANRWILQYLNDMNNSRKSKVMLTAKLQAEYGCEVPPLSVAVFWVLAPNALGMTHDCG